MDTDMDSGSEYKPDENEDEESSDDDLVSKFEYESHNDRLGIFRFNRILPFQSLLYRLV